MRILSRSLALLFFDLLDLEGENFLHKARQRVIDLEERIEVAGVANVPQSRRLIHLPDALIYPRDRFVVSVHRRLRLHRLLDYSLQIFIFKLGLACHVVVGHVTCLPVLVLLLGRLTTKRHDSGKFVVLWSAAEGRSSAATTLIIWIARHRLLLRLRLLLTCVGICQEFKSVFYVSIALLQGLDALVLCEPHRHEGVDVVSKYLLLVCKVLLRMIAHLFRFSIF